MLLDLLRELEDQNTKLGGCLERGDTSQARDHHAAIRRLIIEAAVMVLRTGEGQAGPPAIDFEVPPR